MQTAQVRFLPIGEEAWQGGILFVVDEEHAYIICGCCGGVYEMDDIEKYDILDWIDISNEIKGD